MGRHGAALTNTILVTGAGGFVGSAVVRALVSQRVGRVVALVRPTGNLNRLERLAPSADWTVARVDMTDSGALTALLSDVKPRAIVHLALDPQAVREPSNEVWRQTVDRPLETMFAALGNVEGARFVTTGSASVLPPGNSLNEDVEPSPSPSYLQYARTKLHEESQIVKIGARLGVPWIHLRLFYMFGRYESRTRLLPHIVSHLLREEPADLSSGEQVRDFTDVDDVAGAYLRALEAGEDRCRHIYHIGSGRGISIRTFANVVADVLGRRDLLRFGAATHTDRDERAIVADASRARRNLGWSAASDTRDKIRLVTRWWIEKLSRES